MKQLAMIVALCLAMAFPAFAQGFHMQLGPLHGGFHVGPDWDGGGWHGGGWHGGGWGPYHHWGPHPWGWRMGVPGGWPRVGPNANCWVWNGAQWVWTCY